MLLWSSVRLHHRSGIVGRPHFTSKDGADMFLPLSTLWSDEQGQDIAEYAVMLAVILVLVVGTVRLIGSNANTVFSQASSSMQ
jgi:Flp pilus assembly pilin Flp